MVNVIRQNKYGYLSNSNISFGNEERKHYSTYQLDFCRSHYKLDGTKMIEPIAGAQILFKDKRPAIDHIQWMTTTQQDFSSSGDAVHRFVYDECKYGYSQAPHCLKPAMVGKSMLHGAHASPMVTNYNLEFQEFKKPESSISQQWDIITHTPKSSDMKNSNSAMGHSSKPPELHPSRQHLSKQPSTYSTESGLSIWSSPHQFKSFHGLKIDPC